MSCPITGKWKLHVTASKTLTGWSSEETRWSSPSHLFEVPQLPEPQDTCRKHTHYHPSDNQQWDFRSSVCSYPRCADHPYRTGDWTEWWGACPRASGQPGSTEPRGCGPSNSSCTLRKKIRRQDQLKVLWVTSRKLTEDMDEFDLSKLSPSGSRVTQH